MPTASPIYSDADTSESGSGLDAEQQWFQAANELVLHLREEGHFLSPVDLETLGDWWEDSLPLPAVLRGIRIGAGRLSRLKRAPRGLPLKRLDKDVRKEASPTRKAAVGRQEEPPVTGPAPYRLAGDRFLKELSAKATAADPRPQEAPLLGILDALESLQNVWSCGSLHPELAYAQLVGLARRWYEELRLGLSERERTVLRDQAEATLGSAGGGMAPEALEATLDELSRRELRKRWPIFDIEDWWSTGGGAP